MKQYKKNASHHSSVLPPPLQTPKARINWLRYFFLEEEGASPHQQRVIDLQQRACWIGLAILLQWHADRFQSLWIQNTHLPYLLATSLKIFSCVFTLGGIFMLWQALRPQKTLPRSKKALFSSRWVNYFLLLMLFLVAGTGLNMGITALVMCFQAPQLTNDGTSFAVNAAISLLQGHNPYTASNLLDVVQRLAISPDWTTPLRQGQFLHHPAYPTSPEVRTAFAQAMRSGVTSAFETKVNYPALSFLILVPFAFFKHYNVLPIYFLSYILIIFIAWKSVLPAIRPWLLVLAIANIPMWDSVIGGNLDVFCYLFITLAWLRHEQRWQSALCLGIAVASKQVGWLFVPFYLVFVWRSLSLREAMIRSGIIMIPFLVNLPFLIWDPQSWLAGLSALVVDPTFPLGTGIIALSNANILPYLPNWCYTLMGICALACALIWYRRWCQRFPEAAIILAVVPLFFSWRSLPSYFACTAFTLFVLLAARKPMGISAPMYSELPEAQEVAT